MNQKKKIKLIATIIIIAIILIMIICAYADRLYKNKLTKNKLSALSDGNVTTIDITGITPSPESQHEHIYKTYYDNTKHWEECTICNVKRNEVNHSFITTWANGRETCHYSNSYTKNCSCGYSETGHKPCVWNGSAYNSHGDQKLHAKKCSVCQDEIYYTYYLNKYGQGTIYQNRGGENKDPRGPWRDQCIKANGSRIMCQDVAQCAVCKFSYTEGWAKHRPVLGMPGKDGKVACAVCNEEFGTATIKFETDSSTPAINTYTIDYKFTKGVTFLQTKPNPTDGITPFTMYTQTISNKNADGSEFTLTTKAKLKPAYTTPVEDGIYLALKQNGKQLEYGSGYIKFYPDGVKPVISNIQISNNTEWKKSKSITISGTENWTNTVNIKIENDRGKVVYEGTTNVINKNWSISCIPDIEAGEDNRIFKLTVTDSCENSITQEFDISKVDGKPPTVTSPDKVTNSEWAREKTFTFTAEDLGIGNVEIGFNDVADYSPAIKDGNNYSKEYKFVGDAYSPVKGSVYFKDGLGNITTQVVTLEKIDNTAPSITNASLNNNVINITSHDRHLVLGEGSGVIKYRYITSTEKLEKPELTENNSHEIGKDELLTIPNINEVKYIYIVAEDFVGNVSESYEIEVPQLELRSEVNEEGTITLNWEGYDKTNKYFVIYCKQEGEEKWKTVVGLDEKLNSNTYTLGNDTVKPNTPEVTIEKNIGADQIKVNQTSTDNGTTYTYYIESYDKDTNILIAKSNIN